MATPPDFKAANPILGAVSQTALVIWVAVSLGLVAVDAFGIVSVFGVAGAILFWTGLVGLNMAGWSAWRRAMPADDRDWARLGLGAVLLNGLLAVEVPVLHRMLGRADAPLDWRPPVYGLFATVFIVFLLRRVRARHSSPTEPAAPSAAAVAAPTVAILARAGVGDVADLLWVRAEDHYCRLGVRGRDSVLIHYRFRDAVDDLRDCAGTQVHRSAWVADRAVAGARRNGRRWTLDMTDGSSVPVSEASIALCRARGWTGSGDEPA